MKERKGASPVPGPTMMMGVASSAGSLQEGTGARRACVHRCRAGEHAVQQQTKGGGCSAHPPRMPRQAVTRSEGVAAAVGLFASTLGVDPSRHEAAEGALTVQQIHPSTCSCSHLKSGFLWHLPPLLQQQGSNKVASTQTKPHLKSGFL